MKTVTTIHLNGRAYQIEDEAHKALAAYLDKASAALDANPDKEEILGDFEQAIAEKFAAYLSPIKNVITRKEIETIISEMGPVGGEQSGDEQNSAPHKDTESPNGTDKPKRLYRDPDNRVIAGVASGLAQYFGIDPAIVRIIFLISILAGGTGVVIYAILWLAVPEAGSTAQKLEMRGSHVTLSSMTEMLKEKIDEVRSPNARTAWQKIIDIPVKILRAIGHAIQKGIFPAVRILFGLIFMCIGFAGAVSITIALGLALFAVPSGVSDLALITASAGATFSIALVAGYIAVVIPFVFFFFVGLGAMEGKRTIRGKVGISFLVLWFAAIIVSGVLGARTVFTVRQTQMNDASFQITTQTQNLAPFTELAIANGQRVTFVPGTEYSVTTEGRARDTETLSIESTGGKLSIERRPVFDKTCFLFCFGGRPVLITVTAPSIERINLENASHIEGSFAGKSLEGTFKNASHADILWNGTAARFTLENGSSVAATGTSTTLDLTLKNASRYEGRMLNTESVHVVAENASSIELGTSKILSVLAHNGSRIEYEGTPRIEKTLKNGSTLVRSEE